LEHSAGLQMDGHVELGVDWVIFVFDNRDVGMFGIFWFRGHWFLCSDLVLLCRCLGVVRRAWDFSTSFFFATYSRFFQ
jgi:hypothetical protein